jgi:vitamin B12/bleomycin/antimicrobial peptide transport system ATP-binding/permease protein
MDQDVDPCTAQQKYCEVQLVSRHDPAWQVIKYYWQSKQCLPVTIFFTIVAVVTISLVALDLIFNYWYYNYFYYALQGYDKHGIVRLLTLFFMFTACYLVLSIHRYSVSQLLGRRWLSQQFICRLIQKHEQHSLKKGHEKMAGDLRTVINFSLDLSMGVVVLLTTFTAFMYYLCQLSHDMTLHFGKLYALQVPGYLVWMGIFYGIAGTFFILKRGQRQWLRVTQQQNEIAHVAQVEHPTLANSYLIVLRKKIVPWFLAGYSVVYLVLSLVLVLPHFVDKICLIGILAQSLQAFMRGQKALSFLLNSHSLRADFAPATLKAFAD